MLLPRAAYAIWFLLALAVTMTWVPAAAFDLGRKVEIPLSDGSLLPAYYFFPTYGVRQPVPGVVVGVGVGGQKFIQYQLHCRWLADRGFAVVLIDPSNYPEALEPGPYAWDRLPGSLFSVFNQVVVGAKLFAGLEWYLGAIRSTVNHLCSSPGVDPTRIVISGFSQPANAALTYACRDPRVKAVVWNYGGWPWIMPYDPYKLPPVLIFHGTEDKVYDVKYALELEAELRAAGRDCEANIYPGQDHMFTVYFDPRTEEPFERPVIQDSFERLISFLYRKLFFCTPVPLPRTGPQAMIPSPMQGRSGRPAPVGMRGNGFGTAK